MGAILEAILGGVSKLLPFLLAFFAGKQNVEKKDLEETVKEGKVRNEIEAEANDLDRVAIIKRLRDLQGDK